MQDDADEAILERARWSCPHFCRFGFWNNLGDAICFSPLIYPFSAIQIVQCVPRYLLSRAGDKKKLKPPLTRFRLRCGDYRIFFDIA